MDFFTSTEFQLGLIIELGMLLLIALGVIVFLLRRVWTLSRQPKTVAKSGPSVQDYLQAEISKTQEKQARLGKTNRESLQLRAACDVRVQVLEGELQVLESAATDETQYWRPVHDYYTAIHARFADKVKTLEERLQTYQQRLVNLEKFKEKVFDLRDSLGRAYEKNSQLVQELREKIKQGAKLSELEHTLRKMEREKEELSQELQLAEREFMAIMENAAKGTTSVVEVSQDVSEIIDENKVREETLTTRIQEIEKENEFLCKQIEALLSEEVKLDNKDQKQSQEFLLLEKRYADLEARYLALQEELDKQD